MTNTFLLPAGSDYLSAAVEIELGPSVDRGCLDIDILDDSDVEDTETFEVRLESSDTEVEIMISTATVTILDNDSE